MVRSPEARLERRVLNAIVGLLAFVGVSSSVSPWLEDLYGQVAVVVLILGLVVSGIVALTKLPDWALDREVRQSWKEPEDGGNAKLVRELTERHMADPEVTTRLAEQALQEKLARQQMAGQPHVPPPTKG
jgi:hypothetical protein